jgi:hypothetical protein
MGCITALTSSASTGTRHFYEGGVMPTWLLVAIVAVLAILVWVVLLQGHVG